mmetsp:Transcript_1963/g.3021  ORF Transcript_1963/g.3021 Transcript_1963/m.3021 type:complete len:99 (+) Transcript_1963:161-457(+)
MLSINLQRSLNCFADCYDQMLINMKQNHIQPLLASVFCGIVSLIPRMPIDRDSNIDHEIYTNHLFLVHPDVKEANASDTALFWGFQRDVVAAAPVVDS